MTTTVVVIAALVLLSLLVIVIYNGLVRLRNEVRTGWSNIDVQLKRRIDLIPNLVETVKGYATHERETFTRVTEARARAQQAKGPGEAAAASSLLGAALGGLFAVAEAYPQLAASENFRHLQAELADTEDKIAAARRYYNSTVLRYHNKLQTFPNMLVARPFGFKEEELFEVEESAREAPRVSFGARDE